MKCKRKRAGCRFSALRDGRERQRAEKTSVSFVLSVDGHAKEAFSCPWCAPLEANPETFIWYNKDDYYAKKENS